MDIKQSVQFTVAENGSVTVGWKSGTQAYYSQPHVNPGDPNAQAALITDEDLQAAYDAGELTIYSDEGLYKSDAAADVVPLTEEELKAYFDEKTSGYYSSNSTGTPLYAWHTNGSGKLEKYQVNGGAATGDIDTLVNHVKIDNGLYAYNTTGTLAEIPTRSADIEKYVNTASKMVEDPIATPVNNARA